jgi:DNA gyrase inhibitor GyrI
VYVNVKNAYIKGGMYCIYKQDGIVDKYPMVNIFRVQESY